MTPLPELNAAKRLPLIGRETYLGEIQECFNALTDPMIYYLEGDGGVGKTVLLQECLRVFRINDRNIVVADELIDFYHAEFQSCIGLAQGIIDVLNSKVQFKEYLDRVDELQVKTISGLLVTEAEWEDAWSIFAETLSDLAMEYPIVLALDTIEILEYVQDRFQRETDIELPLSTVGDWLLRTIFPQTHGKILWLWAGRPTMLRERLRDKEDKKNVIIRHLKPLNEKETIDYLYQIIKDLQRKPLDLGVTQRIQSAIDNYAYGIYYGTGGRPILLSIVADILMVGGSLPKFFYIENPLDEVKELSQAELIEREKTLLEHLLKPRPPLGKTLRAMAYLHKGANPVLLSRVASVLEGYEIDENDAQNRLRLVSELALVKVKANREILYFLHDEIYDLFNKYQSDVDSAWKHLLPRIEAYYDELEKEITSRFLINPDRERRKKLEVELRRLKIERAHYQIFGDPEKGAEIYFVLAADLLEAHDNEMDMLMRSELLRTLHSLKAMGRLPDWLALARDLNIAIRWGVRYLLISSDLKKAREVFKQIESWDVYKNSELKVPQWHLALYKAVLTFKEGDYSKARMELNSLRDIIRDFHDYSSDNSIFKTTRLLAALTSAYLGYVERMEGNYYSAIKFYQEAVAEFEQLNVGVLISTSANLIYAMIMVGYFRRAEQILSSALAFARRGGSAFLEARLRNIAIVSATLTWNPFEAAKHIQVALGILRREISNPRLEGLVCLNAARAYRYQWNRAVMEGTETTSWADTLLRAYQLLEAGGEINGLPSQRQSISGIKLLRDKELVYYVEAQVESGCIFREMAWLERKVKSMKRLYTETFTFGEWRNDFAQASQQAEERFLSAAGININDKQFDKKRWRSQIETRIIKLKGDCYWPTLALVNLAWYYRYQQRNYKEIEALCSFIEELIPQEYHLPHPQMKRGESGVSLLLWAVLGKLEMLRFDLALQIKEWSELSSEQKELRLKEATLHATLSLRYNTLMGEAAFDRQRAEEGLEQRFLMLAEDKPFILPRVYQYARECRGGRGLQARETKTEFEQWLVERFGPAEIWKARS